MPRQRSRRERRPNVFVQQSNPRGREEVEEDVPGDAVEGTTESSTGTAAVSAGRTRRLRAQRAARQARARSEIFTRTVGGELRKLGILSGGIVVILVVLTFVL